MAAPESEKSDARDALPTGRRPLLSIDSLIAFGIDVSDVLALPSFKLRAFFGLADGAGRGVDSDRCLRCSCSFAGRCSRALK